MKRIYLLLLMITLLFAGCNQQPKKDLASLTYPLPLKESPSLFQETKDYTLEESKTILAYPKEFKKVLQKGCEIIGIYNDILYLVSGTDEADNEYFFSYDLNTRCWKKIFSRALAQSGFLSASYKDSILLGEGSWNEKGFMDYTITQYTENEKKVLYQGSCSGLPTAQIIDHYIVLNDSIQGEDNNLISILKTIDLDTLQEETVFEDTYSRLTFNEFSGNMAVCNGGWSKGFCFNVLKMDNEDITVLHAGESSIHYYSFETHTSKKLMDFQTHLMYMAGNTDFLITSDYSIGSEDTGRLIVRQGEHYEAFWLSGVFPGNDIGDSLQLTDTLYFVDNGDDYYLVDLDTRKYSKGNQKKLVKGLYYHYGWVHRGDELMCITDNSKLVLHQYHVKSTKEN